MRKFLSVFILLIVICCALFIPFIKTVSVGDYSGRYKAVYSAKAVNGFVISYTHSVNKGRVHDYYNITKDGLLLDKTVFVSYGAGIPEPGETSGAVFKVTDEGYEISGLNRQLDQLVMAVGVIAEHSISWGGEEYFLKNWFPVQTRLIIKPKKVNLFNYWRHNGYNRHNSSNN